MVICRRIIAAIIGESPYIMKSDKERPDLLKESERNSFLLYKIVIYT